MPRTGTAPRIVFVGAGSTVFAKNLLGDILGYPALANAEIRLYDIDPVRLRTSEVVAHRVARVLGANPTVIATVDREKALDGADYVITMIQVAGYRPGTVIDFEIPAKYGLRQTIADTLGIGGIMRRCAPCRCCSSWPPTWSASAPTRCTSTTRTRWR